MNLQQEALAIQTGAQLIALKNNVKAQISQVLNQTLKPALTTGITRGGVSVSSAELQEKMGAELWAQLVADKEELEAFLVVSG